MDCGILARAFGTGKVRVRVASLRYPWRSSVTMNELNARAAKHSWATAAARFLFGAAWFLSGAEGAAHLLIMT